MSIAIKQRTPEWHQARSGKITASQFGRIFLGGEPAWQSYMKELDEGAADFTSESTEWGNRHERPARGHFRLSKLDTGEIQLVGFAIHPDYPMMGASPDFLIGEHGGGEIKCPFNQTNHHQVLLSQKVPEKYRPQIQGSMWVTGRQYWWFISFDPRIKDSQQKLIAIKVLRDDLYIQKLKTKLLNFWKCYTSDRDTGRYFGIKLDNEIPLPF